jgi:hypothetical protein
MQTADSVVLGEGTPSASWIKGVVTTDALPGASWAGIALAGSSDGHYLSLNFGNGALSGADTLYCNLKVVIPSSQTDAGAVSPIIAIKYCSIS